MPTKDQENEMLTTSFEESEAGVANLVVFYETVEDVYRQASASIRDTPSSYASDSTDVTGSYAHLG